MPDRTNLFRRFHQPDTRSWSKERKKERKKEPRKETPPKGKRIDLLPFRLSGSLAIHLFFSLSLSLSPIRLGSTKRKRQTKKKSPPAQIVAENPTKRTHIKKNHLITNRFAWASTLLLEARSDPLTGLRFPPPSSCHWSCHCTCSWLVPRMICRTAPASCVSVSHQCLFF